MTNIAVFQTKVKSVSARSSILSGVDGESNLVRETEVQQSRLATPIQHTK